VFSSRLAAPHSRPALASQPGAVGVFSRPLHRPQAPRALKRWAHVATATLLVVGAPVAIVWWLRSSGAISSPAVAVVVGTGLSLCASQVGRVIWERRPRSEDLLFSELMLWGFVHRWHTQRRLGSALEMLGPIGAAQQRAVDGLSTRQQAKLLEQLVSGLETRDPYLHGHSRRVARHAWMIARRMGLPREEVARIRTAAAIHDVGKIETPKAILHKAGPLTFEEYEVIKKHPSEGARMAAILRDSDLTSIVLHHHERLDGSGYPHALGGSEIPLGARIIAVADTFDAITSTRPYRSSSSHRTAIDILRKESGTRLDPAVVRAFCGHYAGRRPIFLSASVAGLPERVVSWFGGGVASVASAAKMLAVAALVGGVAATSSTLPLAGAGHDQSQSTASRAQVQSVRLATANLSMATISAGKSRARSIGPVGHSAAARRKPAAQRAISSGAVLAAAAASPSATVGGGSAEGPGLAGGNRGHGEEAHSRGSESVGQPKAEGAPRNGEAPHGKSEEAHGKSEEAHGKSGEAHGKSGEAHGKSGEAHGKSEENGAPLGKSEEAHGKSEEPHGNSEGLKVKSEEAHGKSEEAPGKSEAPHGKSEEHATTPAHGSG
jgi:hypothetical protein